MVVQLVKCLTLDFSLGNDPMVIDGDPCQAPCSAGSQLEILSLLLLLLSLPLAHSLSLSFSLSLILS